MKPQGKWHILTQIRLQHITLSDVYAKSLVQLKNNDHHQERGIKQNKNKQYLQAKHTKKDIIPS